MLVLKRFISLISFCTIFSLSDSTHAQISFSHAIGLAYYTGSIASSPAVTYSPRINLVKLSEEITLSAGTHFGFTAGYSSHSGISIFAFDLPLLAELNFGHAAHRQASSKFGGFLGAGYGISKLGPSGDYSNHNDAAGPVINAGLRLLISNRSFGLRTSYLFNTKEDASDVFGAGLFYTFGKF